MRYRTLGSTGIDVSVYCLGTMMFGREGNPDHERCRRMVDTALDAGINFVDTADMYSSGESEEIVGKALKGRRHDVVLATKVHFPLSEGVNRGGNSRRWITRAVEDSLRRLGTDYLDLYQVHRPDPKTDIGETLSTLTDLVSAGTIRAFGCSSFPAEYIVEARSVSDQRGLGRFQSEQPPYSLLARGAESDVFPACQRLGMGVLTWSPLAFGFLTGRHRSGTTPDTEGRVLLRPEAFDPGLERNRAKFQATEQLAQLADDLGCDLPHLAAAFVVAHPAVTSAIIGPRTMAQLVNSIEGAELLLEDDVLDRIDEIVAPGTDLYHVDNAWQRPSLARKELRRRHVDDRAAA